MDMNNGIMREIIARFERDKSNFRPVKTHFMVGTLVEVSKNIEIFYNTTEVLDVFVYKDGVVVVFREKVDG